VKVTGSFPRFFMNNSNYKHKLISVDQWGDIQWTSMERAFYGCENLQITATDVPDLSKVENMSMMFYYVKNFSGNISNWDVGNVKNMTSMFYQATSFNSDLSKRDVSNVTSMAGMFQ
jgi:surface protein